MCISKGSATHESLTWSYLVRTGVLRLAVLRVLCCSVWVFRVRAILHGALKHGMSTLLTTLFL